MDVFAQNRVHRVHETFLPFSPETLKHIAKQNSTNLPYHLPFKTFSKLVQQL
jgi:hypothetical protein